MATPKSMGRYLSIVGLLAGSIGCDQATKAVARDQLSGEPAQSFLGGTVRLVHAENPGAFLGLGKNLPESWRLGLLIGGVSIVLLVVAFALFRRLQSETGRWPSLVSVGLGLLLAGGIGNLIDRAVGASTVTDFVQLRLWFFSTGVFNVADVFIIIGAVAIGWLALRPEKPDEETPQPSPSPA